MNLPWELAPVLGERVILDLLGAADLDALHTIQSDPHICQYLLYEPRTREQVAETIVRDSAATRLEKKGDHIQPAIRLPDGTLLGTMYFTITSEDDETGEIGWVLAKDAQGKGYAREAAALVLDLAFGPVGLHRVAAELDPRNAASIALCLRLGMREEAHFVEHMMFKGAWADTGIYGILDREWRESPLAS